LSIIASKLLCNPLFSPNHHAICGTHLTSTLILLGTFSQDWASGVWSWPVKVTNV
jgi:hypothetical protein